MTYDGLTRSIDRGEHARQKAAERFARSSPVAASLPSDPMAFAAFLNLKAFKFLSDGTMQVTFLVPPHLSQETYMTLAGFCRNIPLAVSVEVMSDEVFAEVAERT